MQDNLCRGLSVYVLTSNDLLIEKKTSPQILQNVQSFNLTIMFVTSYD